MLRYEPDADPDAASKAKQSKLQRGLPDVPAGRCKVQEFTVPFVLHLPSAAAAADLECGERANERNDT